MNKTALVIGATGLVGNELVDILLDQEYYDSVKVVVRRPLDIAHPKLQSIILEDFDKMEEVKYQLDANDYYCCLGTTIKTAGSKEAFRKVDLEYPFQIAQIAKSSTGFRSFLIVTAAGSNAKSSIFYNQVKGELENKLKDLNLRSLKIFHPTLLLGDRSGFRFGEVFGKWVLKVISLVYPNYWSVEARDVAKSMFEAVKAEKVGEETFEAKEIVQMAKSVNS